MIAYFLIKLILFRNILYNQVRECNLIYTALIPLNKK